MVNEKVLERLVDDHPVLPSLTAHWLHTPRKFLEQSRSDGSGRGSLLMQFWLCCNPMFFKCLNSLAPFFLAGWLSGCDQVSTPPLPPKVGSMASQPQSGASTQPPPVSSSAASGPSTATAEPIRDDLKLIARLIGSDKTGPGRVQLLNYLKLHPGDSQATFLFGLSYHREKKYGEAVEYFDKALAAAVPYRTTNHFRGWAMFYLGELEESRKSFQAFLVSQPDEPDSHYALGLIELDSGNLDEAARLFHRCFELAEKDNRQAQRKLLSKARYGIGRVHEQNGELGAAKAEFAGSAELFPDHYEALYRLHRVLVRLGEVEQAKIVQRQYLQTKERVRPGTSFPE
jgi:Tfp pilus assembly protein PilF